MKPDNEASRATQSRVLRRIGAVGLACILLGAACGNPSTPVDWGDAGSSGSGSSGATGATSSGASSGNNASGSGSGGSSSGGSNSGGSTSSGSGSGNSSGSSSGGGSSGGSGSSSGSADSGTRPPVPCGDGGTATGSSSGSSTDTGASCPVTASGVRVTEIDVGIKYLYQEIDANGGKQIGMALLAISSIPSGGSRVAFLGTDGMVHIAQLDANDQLVAGSVFGLPAWDFQDTYADNTGGVVLVTRDAMGGGTGNCGNPSHLCGTAPHPPPPPCAMYMVRFDSCGNEIWATKLTTSSASNPPYLASNTDTTVRSFYVWWYAHNGRIAFDGSHYAGYYGAAVSVVPLGMTCLQIHQGDEMRIVDMSGNLQTGGFTEFGCSHSFFERLTWDGAKFVPVCGNDGVAAGSSKTGQIKFAAGSTIYPVDAMNVEVGSVLKAGGGGEWVIATDLRSGQAAGNPGLDDVHLLHTTTGTADQDIKLVSDPGLNDRNPHLAAFGTNRMFAAWETSTTQAPQGGHLDQGDTNRKLYVQALDNTTAAAQGSPYYVSGVLGSRYQDFRTYPDGSAAYAAPGSAATKIKIVRVTPCK